MTIELNGKTYNLRLTNRIIPRLEERLETGPLGIITRLTEGRASILVDLIWFSLEDRKLTRNEIEKIVMDKKDSCKNWQEWRSWYSALSNGFTEQLQALKLVPKVEEDEKNVKPAGDGTGNMI